MVEVIIPDIKAKSIIHACAMILIVSSLFAACISENQKLSIPEYPIDKAAIVSVLQKIGLDWEVTAQTHAIGEPHSVYRIYRNDTLLASVVGISAYDERSLSVLFMSFQNALSEDELETAIVFATLLFGGFDGTHQIYERFQAEFGVSNTTVNSIEGALPRPYVRDQTAVWVGEFKGVYCRIIVEREASTHIEYLARIDIVSDLETFGLESWRTIMSN